MDDVPASRQAGRSVDDPSAGLDITASTENARAADLPAVRPRSSEIVVAVTRRIYDRIRAQTELVREGRAPE